MNSRRLIALVPIVLVVIAVTCVLISRIWPEPSNTCSLLGTFVNKDDFSARHHKSFHFERKERFLVSSANFEDCSKIPVPSDNDEKISCIRRTDGFKIWQLQGYSLANVTVLELNDHLVVVDGGETPSATVQMLLDFEKDRRNHENTWRKPISHVILTHYHPDHAGGLGGIARYNRALHYYDDVVVISNQMTHKLLRSYYTTLTRSKYRRGVKQFGINSFARSNAITAGIGPKYNFEEIEAEDIIYPNLLLSFTNTHETKSIFIPTTLSIADDDKPDVIQIDISWVPGETRDQINIWIPQLKYLNVADNFYFAFPNVYPLRGAPARDVNEWVDSIDYIYNTYGKEIKTLGVGHTSAIIGNDLIQYILIRYRDGLKFVHDQTLRILDIHSNPNQVADEVVRLLHTKFPIFSPPSYQYPDQDQYVGLHDPLMPYYGRIEWAVKSIISNTIGWFDENPVNLLGIEGDQVIRRELLKGSNIYVSILEMINRGECNGALVLLTQLGMDSFPYGNESSISLDRSLVSLDIPESCEKHDIFYQTLETEKIVQNCQINNDIYDEESAYISLRDGLEGTYNVTTGGCFNEFGTAVHLSKSDLACLYRKSLSCVAQSEISSSGRNWLNSEASPDPPSPNYRLSMRRSIPLAMPQINEIIESFEVRYVPSTNTFVPSYLVLYFTVAHGQKTRDNTLLLQTLKMNPGVGNTFEPPSETTVFELVLRNNVLNVKSIGTVHQYNMHAAKNAHTVEVQVTEEDFRALVSGSESKIKLLLTRRLPLPTGYSHPADLANLIGIKNVQKPHMERISDIKTVLALLAKLEAE